jgi:hypothetical protein
MHIEINYVESRIKEQPVISATPSNRSAPMFISNLQFTDMNSAIQTSGCLTYWHNSGQLS